MVSRAPAAMPHVPMPTVMVVPVSSRVFRGLLRLFADTLQIVQGFELGH